MYRRHDVYESSKIPEFSPDFLRPGCVPGGAPVPVAPTSGRDGRAPGNKTEKQNRGAAVRGQTEPNSLRPGVVFSPKGWDRALSQPFRLRVTGCDRVPRASPGAMLSQPFGLK